MVKNTFSYPNWTLIGEKKKNKSKSLKRKLIKKWVSQYIYTMFDKKKCEKKMKEIIYIKNIIWFYEKKKNNRKRAKINENS